MYSQAPFFRGSLPSASLAPALLGLAFTPSSERARTGAEGCVELPTHDGCLACSGALATGTNKSTLVSSSSSSNGRRTSDSTGATGPGSDIGLLTSTQPGGRPGVAMPHAAS